jgi:hypothetical protein
MENITPEQNTENNTSDLNILSKGDDPKVKKPDYFKLRITGQLPDNAVDQVKTTNGEDLKLSTKEDLWKDEEIKKSYTEKYGNTAFDKFYEDYNKVQSNYNQFQFLIGGKSTREAIINNEKNEDEADYFGIKESGFSPNFSLINKTDTGALDLFDIHTEATHSVDKSAIDQGGFYDPAYGEWRTLNKPGTLEAMGIILGDIAEMVDPSLRSTRQFERAANNYDPIDNPLYTDKNGNRIAALRYVSGEELKKEMLDIDPNSQYGEDVRGQSYMRAVYEGEELGGKAVVSKLDLIGVTDPQLKSGTVRSIASALPRAIINTSTGIVGGAASSMIALNDLVVTGDSNDSGFRRYMAAVDASMKSAKMGVSEESKTDMFTQENIYTNIANITIQLVAGYGLASVAGKAGSVIGLTSMAVESSRDEAIAAGFNQEEAAVFQLASIAGMAAANVLFGWVDKKTAAKELAAKLTPELKLAYQDAMKAAAKETTKEGRKKSLLESANKIYISTKNIAKSVSSKFPEGMVPEALEEGTEGLFDHINKQLANVIMKDDSQKGFMSLNDPEFAKQFYQEMGMSMAMGGLGGAMSNQAIKLFSKGRNTEDKTSVTNLILSGRINEYFSLLDKLRKTKNGLGSDNLSTEFDNQSGSFKAMSEGAISHNEANYRLLINEANAIQQVIKSMGAKKALDFIKSDDDFKDSKLAGTAIQDVQNLTKRYLEIVSAAPSIQEAALDTNMKFESSEKESEYFSGLAKTYNTSEENIRELVKIKKDIKDVNTGLKTEEYIFSNMIKLDRPEKFDENFTGNLFRALKKKQAEKEEEAKDLKDIAEKSQIAAEALKDDLSNVSEISNFKIATDKAKAIIEKKFKDYKLNDLELRNFTEKITEQYLLKDINGNYANEEINEELLFVARQMALNNIDETDLGKKVEDNFKLLSEIHDGYYTKQLENLNGNSSKPAIDNIANFSPISFMSMPTIDKDGNQQFDSKNLEFIINNNSGDVKSIVDEFISVESKNFPVNKYSQLGIADANVIATIKGARNKITTYNQFMKVAKNESFIKELTNNLDYIWEEVVGEGDKVSVGNSFYNRLHGKTSIHEVVKSKNNNGVDLFDDVTSTKNLLEQIKIKQSLMRGLVRYHTNLSDYRSGFTRLMNTLDTKDSRSVKDILKVFNSTYPTTESMKNFSDVIFDSRKLLLLRNKYKDSIEAYKLKFDALTKEYDLLQEQKEKAGNEENFEKVEEIKAEQEEIEKELDTLNKSHENEIGDLIYLENVKKIFRTALNDLNENEKKLNKYLEIAEGNQNIDNKLKNRMNGTANSVKSNTQKAGDFLDFIKNNVDDNISKLIDREDENVKQFLDYYNNQFDSDSKSAEVLKEDNTVLYKFYDYLRTATKRDNINEALFHYFEANFDRLNNNSTFNRLLIASQFDIREFNKRFDELSKTSPDLAYSEQEEVALTAAAHVNSNISNIYFSFRKRKDISDKRKNKEDYTKSDITIEADDVMTLFGNAGAGKSTFGLGIGLNIGLDIKGKENKVFLASNTNPQINTLKKTADDFGFKGRVAETGTFNELLDYLQRANDNKLNETELAKLNMIVFDEATVQSADARDRDSQASSSYSINKILYLVSELNKKRANNNRIKVILSGDPKQNGYVKISNETGGLDILEKNIGNNREVFFGTAYLDLNIRSKVQAITEIARIIKDGRYHEGEIVGNNTVSDKFKSVYGTHELTNTKLGVQFASEDEDMFNNDDLINNIESSIKSNPAFKIGVVGNDIDVDGKRVTELGNSKLDKLILAYPANFEFYTHENVQGQTFEYTIATMDKPTFFDNNSVWLTKRSGESYIAKKLATTIERSNYFTLVVNKTDRRFDSKVDENLTLVSSKLESAVVTDVKEFLFKTRPDTSITVAPIVTTTTTPAVVTPAPIVPVPSVVVATTKVEIEKEILRLESELAASTTPTDLKALKQTPEGKKIEKRRQEKLDKVIVGQDATILKQQNGQLLDVRIYTFADGTKRLQIADMNDGVLTNERTFEYSSEKSNKDILTDAMKNGEIIHDETYTFEKNYEEEGRKIINAEYDEKLKALENVSKDEIKTIKDIKIGQTFSKKTNLGVTAKVTNIDTSNELISYSTDKVYGESEFNEFIKDWQLGIKTKEEIEIRNKIQDLTNKLNEIIENELELEYKTEALVSLLDRLSYDKIIKLKEFLTKSTGAYSDIIPAIAYSYFNEVNPDLKKAVDIELDILNETRIPTDPADEALKVFTVLTTEPDPSVDQEKLLEDNIKLKNELINTGGVQDEVDKVLEKTLDQPILEFEKISVIPTAEETINENILSELDSDEKAIEVQKALFNDAGLVSASFTGEMLEGSNENFTKYVIKSFVNKSFSDFNYSLKISEHEEKGVKFKKVFLKIANKAGDFTSIKIFTNDDNSKQFDLSHNDKVLSVKDIQSIINHVTSGKVNVEDQANIPLTEFKESLKKQGLSVSDNIYVYTAGKSMGESFILVSQQSDIDLDQKMSVEHQDSNTILFNTEKSLGKNIRRFKNSTAVIRLNSKPLSKFSTLYNNYMNIMESGGLNRTGGKYVNNFTGPMKTSANIVEFLSMFLEEYSGLDYSVITKNVRATDKGEKLITKISKLDKDKYIGIARFLNKIMQGSIGVDEMTPDNLFIYSFDQETEKKRSLINFDLFLKHVNKELEGDANLDLLDELFEIAFPKGFYARFKAFKDKNNKNTLFAALDKNSVEYLKGDKSSDDFIKFDIDDHYTVNVNPENSLATPIVYINNNELINILNSKSIKISSKSSKVSTEEIIDLINSKELTTDYSSKLYKDIESKINSSKDKKLLNKLFSDRLNELNKSPIDFVLVPMNQTELYKSPEFLFDENTGEIAINNKSFDTSDELSLSNLYNNISSEIDSVNISSEIDSVVISSINLQEASKLMDFITNIYNGINDETLKLKINNFNESINLLKTYENIFPIYNDVKKKFITHELSNNLKDKIISLGFTSNFSEEIAKLGIESIKNKFNNIEFTAIEKYLSSLKDCN